ncbi:ABC transporter permease [Patulibacter defluvii]|uniref:ABC transporter permease n=1 Tax=Patulibacter defluvii TaxID=3095358 RepID=UPI002A74D752|nr:ABC transporter permease [Patulibacter sp. DM4]
MRLRRPRFTTCVLTVVLLCLYAPIVLVIVNSFNADEALVRWGGFTTKWYSEVFENDRVWEDAWTSVKVAVVATAIALVVALSTVLWMRGASPRGRKVMDGATYVRLILPEVVMAFALFIVLRALNVRLGFWPVVAGHVVVYSAYATLVLQARLGSLDRTREEAAADLGAPPRRVFRRVTLVQLMPGIAVAGLLTFTFSFDNVVMSRFLGGSQTETLPVLIISLIRRSVSPEVNALGVLIMLVMLLTVLVAAVITYFRPSSGNDRLLVDPTNKDQSLR